MGSDWTSFYVAATAREKERGSWKSRPGLTCTLFSTNFNTNATTTQNTRAVQGPLSFSLMVGGVLRAGVVLLPV